MAKTEAQTKTKTKASSPRLPSEIFGVEFNPSLVHQALTSYLSSERQGSVLLKNRSAVRGGGKKPFRQKGTGRARAGTIRSPIWVGGGATFANVKNHKKKINKKMAVNAPIPLSTVSNDLSNNNATAIKIPARYTNNLMDCTYPLMECSSEREEAL